MHPHPPSRPKSSREREREKNLREVCEQDEDLAALYEPGSDVYARVRVMMDPEVQRYFLKLWRLFDSAHTGYLPCHEIVAFEVLACKALFSPAEFNAKMAEGIAQDDWARELGAKRKLVVRADFDHSLFEIVEQWTASGSAPEARQLLRRLYDALSQVPPGAVSRKRRWCPVAQVPSLNAALLETMVEDTLRRAPSDSSPTLIGRCIEAPTPPPERLTLVTMFVAKAYIQFKRNQIRRGLMRLHEDHFTNLNRRVEVQAVKKQPQCRAAESSTSSLGTRASTGPRLGPSDVTSSSAKRRPLPVPRMPSSRPQAFISCPQHLKLWSTVAGARPGLWDASCMRPIYGQASRSEVSVRKHTYGVAFCLPPAARLDPSGESCTFTVCVPASVL